MLRIHRLLPCAAAFLLANPLSAAPRVERGSLVFDNVPELQPDAREKLDAYLNSRQATPLGFSPKGQLLITTRFGDVEQLHLVERPGGDRRQLTFLREPITRGAFSPDPAKIGFVYVKDTAGDENTQIYYQRVDEPAAKLLTDGKSVNGGPVWSNSGHEVAFFSTARDGASYDINIVDPAGGLPRLAVSGEGGAWFPLDWSPDDRKLLALKRVSAAETYLYVVDLSSGQKREVDPAPGKAAITGAKFSRDGQGVYLISDRDSEFAQLRYVNLFTNEKTVLSARLSWDVLELAISRDGHYLAYVSNEAGVDKLNVLDLRAHQDLLPPKMPAAGLVGSLSFDADGTHLAFGFAAPNHPRDAYVLDVAANRVEPWTQGEAGAVNLGRFVAPRLVQVPTFDRTDGKERRMPVYIYEPSAPGPHPVLIALHGGPESQFRPAFDPWLEFVVNELGYSVLAPNVRGSSGYGKSYEALDDGALREDAVKDVGALLVWLSLQSAFDAKHVVVSGEGYGGYLTLATLVNFGERLRGGVDMGGMADLVAFLSSSTSFRQSQRRTEYGDERDPDMRVFLRRISPLTNAERISRPVLIVHGRNDARVQATQAEQMLYRLRGRGVEAGYLQANDEGHDFRRQTNRDAYYGAFAQFLITAAK